MFRLLKPIGRSKKKQYVMYLLAEHLWLDSSIIFFFLKTKQCKLENSKCFVKGG